MKKTVTITDIHPNDAFYGVKDVLIGEKITPEAVDLWTEEELEGGWSYGDFICPQKIELDGDDIEKGDTISFFAIKFE